VRVRTVSVVVAPFHTVTAERAALEGEGEGSPGQWRRVHRDGTRRALAGMGRKFSADMPVALEGCRGVFPVAAS
jgi:uncharacterized protein YhfF